MQYVDSEKLASEAPVATDVVLPGGGLPFGFVAPVSAAPPGKTGVRKPKNLVSLDFRILK
ncbi:hypothetical protein D3C75_1369540 [compost metagenome]